MADRYWVGGTATWDTTAGTKWATTSGGAGGASVPTSADSVFFDQVSTYTVNISTTNCLDLTVSAGTVTFTGFANINIFGSFLLATGTTTWSHTGNLNFQSSLFARTITTNGTNISGGLTLSLGASGSLTLGSALTLGGGITHTQGAFSTSASSYSLATAFYSGTFTQGSLNFNASTITTSSIYSSATFTFGTSISQIVSNATFVCAGTSPVISYNGSGDLNLGSWQLTAASTSEIRIGAPTGQMTFNSLSISASTNPPFTYTSLSISSNISVNNFSFINSAGHRRLLLNSQINGISSLGVKYRLTLSDSGTHNLTDIDFENIDIVYGASINNTISGIRLGNCGNVTGIVFDSPKTVYCTNNSNYWETANTWAATSGGVASSNNYPLPQDTAIINNNSFSNINLSSTTRLPTIDFSTRTTAVTLAPTSAGNPIYGDWIGSTALTISASAGGLIFRGKKFQTIKSNGQTFTVPITIDTFNGTTTLSDALTIVAYPLTVTSGTFDTNSYAVTTSAIISSNSLVREIKLNASTVTLDGAATNINFTTNTNLTFNAGTSTINAGPDSGGNWHDIIAGTPNTIAFYNVKVEGSNVSTSSITGNSTFNNLILSHRTSTFLSGLCEFSFSGIKIITGTLSCINTQSTSTVKRIGIKSVSYRTQATLSVNAWGNTPSDIDFQDINLTGSVGILSGTRLGDCGNNTNITFPSPKTIYLVGLNNTSTWYTINSYASTSGGTVDLNNFPLPQDTIVIDNASGNTSLNISLTLGTPNIGTLNATNRTTAATVSGDRSISIYGDFILGTGISWLNTGSISFSNSSATQILNTNGVSLSSSISISSSSTVQLGAALTTTQSLATSGTFNAANYNVTANSYIHNSTVATINMGSGTWTLTGTGTVWNCPSSTGRINSATSNIVLSNNTTTSRLFIGGNNYYNKLTIGGTTSTSTTELSGANVFGELASTKTVAHTILFPTGATSTTVGVWSITGTPGNIVTLNNPANNTTVWYLNILGPANANIDYLSIRYCNASSGTGTVNFPTGQLYAGANSTNIIGNTGVIFTATPVPRTLFWVGGTGNWSSTANWSTSSGGTGGQDIPTSLDSVTFDSASSASAYTITVNTTAKCAAFNLSGPASGSVTFTGSSSLSVNGSVNIAATGVTYSYTGFLYLGGRDGSYTLTTNGTLFTSYIRAIRSTWTLGSAWTTSSSGNGVTLQEGTLNTANYNITTNLINLSTVNTTQNNSPREIILGSSTVTVGTSGTITAHSDSSTTCNLNINAGTSTINLTGSSLRSNATFYNVNITPSSSTTTIIGKNIFNTLSIAGQTTVGISTVTLSANQTIGTLTLAAGTAAAYRTFLASDTLDTQRTLAVTTLTAGAADIDFRDIAVTGTTLTGTRFGDCKGNSGITFPAAKTVYYATSSASNWGSVGTGSWSLTNNGTADATAFPLAQDTAVFPSSPTPYPASGTTVTINANYNIGTVDMSARTTNTMTFATVFTVPHVYGNWINGTGTTLTSSFDSRLIFAGRVLQTITSAGVAFAQVIRVDSPNGIVLLQDALSLSQSNTTVLTVNRGTFDADIYNVTLTGAVGGVNSGVATTRTIRVGSGTWTITGTGSWSLSGVTALTVTGTGTISLTSASAKTFGVSGNGVNYSGITLNQGGAGTLTISGDNTFKNISNSYGATGVTTINLGTTTQTVEQFTALPSTNLLIINGSTTPDSSTGMAKLRLTGSANVSMTSPVAVTAVQFYSGTDTGSWINFDYSSSIVKGYSIFKKLLKPFKAFGDFFTFFS